VTSLDPGTILLMTVLMAAAMSVVLFSAHRSFPAEVRGLGDWALGLAGVVVVAMLFGLRHWLPFQLGSLGAGTVLLAAIGLWLAGTRRFYGVDPGWRSIGAAVAINCASFVWWVYIHPNFAMRAAVFSLIVGTFYFAQFRLVVRHGERHFSTYALAGLLLIQAVAVMTRAVVVLQSGAADGEVTRPGGIPPIYLALANFMVLLLAVAFMGVATRRLQRVLEQRSNQDPLTCVLNRRGFSEVYAKARAKMGRDGLPMTLLSLDLDLFKLINDCHGHAMGDRVLVHVAQMACEALRENDYVARFGGEEFVVLLPDTTIEGALQVAARIQQLVRASLPAGLPAYTVSIGVACQDAADEELDSLLMRADAALYLAKANGRNRIEVVEVDATEAGGLRETGAAIPRPDRRRA
jgi:diguanylate cyclase (GGDEF)-like protein